MSKEQSQKSLNLLEVGLKAIHQIFSILPVLLAGVLILFVIWTVANSMKPPTPEMVDTSELVTRAWVEGRVQPTVKITKKGKNVYIILPERIDCSPD